MKKLMRNLILILILISIVIQITTVSLGTEVDIKTKIEQFINDEENLVFSYENYSSASKIDLNYGGEGLMFLLNGVPVANIEEESLTEEQKEAITKITNGFKYVAYEKEDLDNFFKEKLGIAFDEIEEYDEYREEHTTPLIPNMFFQVKEGGAPGRAEKYNIESIKELENGNIEVKVTYTQANGIEYDEEGNEKIYSNIVTLQPYSSTYKFVSCISADKTINNQDKEEEKDTTVADKEIPQTGENNIDLYVIGVFTIIIVLGVIIYKNRDIK